MFRQFVLGRRGAGIAVATVASLAVAGVAAGTSYAHGSASPDTTDGHRSARASLGQDVHDAYVDVTDQGSQAVTRALRTASRVSHRPAAKAYLAAQPDTTVRDISGTTGTVRFLADLDGYLTGPSSRSPRGVAMRYVRAHADALGLTTGDLDTFHLARNYRDVAGIHHLYFTQRIAGSSAARNGLTASVNGAGRLLTLGGMPISTARVGTLPPASARTITTAAEALALTRGPVLAGADTSEDTARRVVFDTGNRLRPAWETVVTSSTTPATTVIDAVTGEVLLRTPLTQYEHSTGLVYKFFPGSARGGRQVTVDFTKRHWLGPDARRLSGNNSHAYSDVNDDNRAGATEEVHPLRGHSWGYRLQPFHLRFASSFCGNPWPCSWNPNKAYSWRVNRAQNATQVFFFVNNWHDHLKRAPIGFTEAAGNFQVSNHRRGGKGGDPVTTQTDDGAATGTRAEGLLGLPDNNHIDNANMSTPPDGHRPVMQMYLQHQPHQPYPNGDPFSPTNVGDEADTVYHEYTHGLSNRLVVDVHGRSTLGGVQAGAMGEGWSDWYAMDYLVKQHLERDRPDKADVRLFAYDGQGVNFDRTEPLDCKVGQAVRICNGGATGHRGGYTYADYGDVVGGPEVHGDGEIWSQTLWDLRHRLGSRKSESLVTRAMELAPYNPSFLDMRNAILVADTSVFRGADRSAIWRVFAHRGMGFYAGSFGGGDTDPAPSFAMPPSPITTGTITGTVTDHDSGSAVEGVTVTLAFQGSGTVNPTAVTDKDGNYTLSDIPDGHYAKLLVRGRGYQQQKAVNVEGTTTVDFAPRVNRVAPGSGARIADATGQDYSAIGCGPGGAIDGSQSSGWSTNASIGKSTDGSLGFSPKHVTIELGQPLDVTGFAVDPASTCGDDSSSSTAGFVIQTSPDRSTWTTAASGTFTAADDGTLVPLDATAQGVGYVRVMITSDQVRDFGSTCESGGPSGCHFVDLSEIQVFGVPQP
ncbi:MAG TPA: M36 family metallopeptidase [Nocardioides sp.]|uniref:M36 family metallopeptidase n=1 Tax=Nocardioides sp. TaxID=35761 RepID=UPI002F42B0E3